ncbi:MAG: Hsp33 family molecular chaperone HslO, partial [Minicystis sp.]
MVRAITNDGAFRVIAARTTATARGAASAQKARGDVAARFGELLTGTILVREAMAPGLRVQGILKGKGKGSLVADAHPDGSSRGLVNFGAAGKDMSFGPGSILQIMRTLPGGAMHQGVIEVPFEDDAPRPRPLGEDGSAMPRIRRWGPVSAGLMAYMQDSEQIVSTIDVATVMDGDEIVAAGGYIVQLLPEVERGPLMLMTERLSDFETLEALLRKGEASPDFLIDEIFYGMPFTRLEESPLRFGCYCSQLRVLSSLATLPRSDVEELIADNEVLDINCDYCGKDYQIAPSLLRSLLT